MLFRSLVYNHELEPAFVKREPVFFRIKIIRHNFFYMVEWENIGGGQLLSNQILHKTVQDIKEITGFECAVWDLRGICLVMTSEKMIGLDKRILTFCETVVGEPMRIGDGVGMFLVCDEEKPTYILALAGEGESLALAGEMGASQLSNLLFVYK